MAFPFKQKKTATVRSAICVGGWVDPKTKKHHQLRHRGPEHILVYAPTRSGKGVSLIIPTLQMLENESCIITDIKGENWALTAGYRQEVLGHRVLKFDPTCTDGTSCHYNPLKAIRIGTPHEVADALSISQMIVDPDGKGLADHWQKTSNALLGGAILHLLYAQELTDKSLRGLASLLSNPDRPIEETLEAMLTYPHDPELTHGWRNLSGEPTQTNQVIAQSAREALNKSEAERSGVLSTAMSFLSLYRDPIAAEMTATSDFEIDDLMNSETPISLYLVIPPSSISRVRPLVRLMLTQFVSRLTEKMEFENGQGKTPHKWPLTLLFDEFPAFGKLSVIKDAIAFTAGYGIRMMLITQDILQLHESYGREESLSSNCHIRIAFAPNNIQTAEMLSKMCGNITVYRQSMSYSGDRMSVSMRNVQVNETETQRPLLAPDEVSKLPPERMLVFIAGKNPILGTKYFFYEDPVMLARTKIPPPGSPAEQPEPVAAEAPPPATGKGTWIGRLFGNSVKNPKTEASKAEVILGVNAHLPAAGENPEETTGEAAGAAQGLDEDTDLTPSEEGVPDTLEAFLDEAYAQMEEADEEENENEPEVLTETDDDDAMAAIFAEVVVDSLPPGVDPEALIDELDEAPALPEPPPPMPLTSEKRRVFED